MFRILYKHAETVPISASPSKMLDLTVEPLALSALCKAL